MVKNAAAKSHYDAEKTLNSAAARTSSTQTPQFLRNSADEIILSLANAYENERARQVSEWERVQKSRWQRTV